MCDKPPTDDDMRPSWASLRLDPPPASDFWFPFTTLGVARQREKRHMSKEVACGNDFGLPSCPACPHTPPSKLENGPWSPRGRLVEKGFQFWKRFAYTQQKKAHAPAAAEGKPSVPCSRQHMSNLKVGPSKLENGPWSSRGRLVEKFFLSGLEKYASRSKSIERGNMKPCEGKHETLPHGYLYARFLCYGGATQGGAW